MSELNLKERVAVILRNAAESLEKKPSETETKEVKMMAEAALTGGEMITTPADEFEQGVEVFITSSEGEQIPLGVGEYPLQDGRVIVIKQEGVVASISGGEPEGEVEASKDDKPTEQQKEVKSIVESVVKEMKFSETIDALKKENEALKAELESRKTETESAVIELAEQLAELQKPAETKQIKHTDAPKEKGKRTGLTLSEIRKIKDQNEKAKKYREYYSNN